MHANNTHCKYTDHFPLENVLTMNGKKGTNGSRKCNSCRFARLTRVMGVSRLVNILLNRKVLYNKRLEEEENKT